MGGPSHSNPLAPSVPYAPGYSKFTSAGSPTDDTTDTDDSTDGEYACSSCGWETDIENEHKQRPEHWCSECGTIQRFRRLT